MVWFRCGFGEEGDVYMYMRVRRFGCGSEEQADVDRTSSVDASVLLSIKNIPCASHRSGKYSIHMAQCLDYERMHRHI